MSHHDAVHPAQGSVLVTDGEFKHTLGIVRALAAHGHEVHVVAQSTRAPAVHSRAVHAWHRAPPPGDPGYEARLLEIASALEPVATERNCTYSRVDRRADPSTMFDAAETAALRICA